MINSFHLSRIPSTYFGSGSIARLADIIKAMHGRNVLLVTGRSSFRNSKNYGTVTDILKAGGSGYTEVSVDREPTPEMIDSLAGWAREEHAGLVLAIGGGSVIDAGKAVSAMSTVDGSIIDYLEGIGTKTHPGTKIPLIAVPTTAGTGSESTRNAVISEVGETGFKKSLRHENFVPDYAIIDPPLASTCPKSVTAACGMDALNQLVESFLSVKSDPFTESIALSGIENVFSSLESLYRNPSEQPELREKMAYAAFVSGITLANAGLGIVHGFASSIGGYADVPHGIICGRLQASTMEIVFSEIMNNMDAYPGAMLKLLKLCDAAMIEPSSDAERIDSLIKRLFTLEKALELPPLSAYGVTAEIAEKAVKVTSCKESPVKLDTKQLLKIIINNI